MGKRTRHGGGSDSKRQRAGAMIEPGQYGVYVTCNRGREMKAAKEVRPVLYEKAEEFTKDDRVEGEDDEEDEEEEDEEEDEEDVSDLVAKELAELKNNQKSPKLLLEVQLNSESLLFFKAKKPLIPSKFVPKFCQQLFESKVKNTRFVQRLTPIDKSCSSTKEEFVKMATQVLADIEPGTTYAVNMTRRNFDVIERDELMAEIAKVLPKCEHHYKGAEKMIHVYCFKNNIGMSVTDYDEFERLCKFNLQQIFDKSNELK